MAVPSSPPRPRRMRKGPWPVAIVMLAAGLVIVGLLLRGDPGVDLATTETPASAEDRPVRDAMSAIVLEMEDAGELSVEHALAAFATYVAPLPGVEPRSEPITPGSSATLAVAMLHAVFDRLTPEQQAAASEVLTLVPAESIDTALTDGFGPPEALLASAVSPNWGRDLVADPIPPELERFDEAIRRSEAELARRVGRPFQHDIRLAVSPLLTPSGDEVSVGSEMPLGVGALTTMAIEQEDPSRPGETRLVRIRNDELSTTDWDCVIVLALDTVLEPEDPTPLMAHEVFHCLQFEIAAQEPYPYAQLPSNAWLFEGSAQWYGEVVAARPYAGWIDFWHLYIGDNHPLTSRAYDATGFFHYWEQALRADGTDPFKRVVPVLRAGTAGRAGWLAALFEKPDLAYFDGWAPSVHRSADLGDLWNLEAPTWLPPRAAVSRNAPPVVLAPGESLELEPGPAEQELRTILVPDPEDASVISVAGTGPGAAAWLGSEVEVRFGGGSGERFEWCIGARCSCAPPAPAGSALVIAVSGTTVTTSAIVRVAACEEPSEEPEIEADCETIVDTARAGVGTGTLAVGRFGLVSIDRNESGDYDPSNVRRYESDRNCIVLWIDERAESVTGEILLPVLYGGFDYDGRGTQRDPPSDCSRFSGVDLSGPIAGSYDPETGEIEASFARSYAVECDPFGRSVELVSLRGTFDRASATVAGPAVTTLWETGARARAVVIGPFTASAVRGG